MSDEPEYPKMSETGMMLCLCTAFLEYVSEKEGCSLQKSRKIAARLGAEVQRREMEKIARLALKQKKP